MRSLQCKGGPEYLYYTVCFSTILIRTFSCPHWSGFTGHWYSCFVSYSPPPLSLSLSHVQVQLKGSLQELFSERRQLQQEMENTKSRCIRFENIARRLKEQNEVLSERVRENWAMAVVIICIQITSFALRKLARQVRASYM